MSVRSTFIQFSLKAAIGLGALFVVGVLLAAIPNHHAPALPLLARDPGRDVQAGTSSSMPEMDAVDAQSGEEAAMHDMAHIDQGDTPHMHMTAPRPETPQDQKRAKEIIDQLRPAMEKYKDYHVALNEGFKIFRPNLPQKEYHFTNYTNGFLEAATFDPARPTSLLYKRTANGYELVGAMYTMPRRATEEQLNERVPLSVATWHLHTNLCMPRKGQMKTADWSKFGLRGSIATEEACDAAGGTFHPVIFGWMVHVYPYEDSMAKIFAMHHMD
jgi:hypothetical protein